MSFDEAEERLGLGAVLLRLLQELAHEEQAMSAPRFRPLGLSDAMPFGKYAGDELREVLDNDPEYLRWLVGMRGKGFVTDDIYETLKSIEEHGF